MTKQYDVVILGGGVAGGSLAHSLRRQHKTVAVVEDNLFGGTCPNRGCDPKKILLSGLEVTQLVADMQGNGISGKVSVNWPDLMRHKRQYTNPISTATQNGLKSDGVDTYHEHAHFNQDGLLEAGNAVLAGDKYVIATGQRPAILDIPGKQFFKTSTDFLNLDEMPADVTFIGGGYIGFELAGIAHAAGAKVHLIHHNDRPLKQFDQQLVGQAVDHLSKLGVDFHMDTDVEEITQVGDQFVLSGDDFRLPTDMVFCTAGRIPNVDTIGLENVGVKTDAHGVIVDDHLQTSNPNIFAMGDVVSTKRPKLTPVAGYEAAYLANYFNGAADKIQFNSIPTIVFGQPSLGQVGLPSSIAADDSRYMLITNDMTAWYSYHRLNEPLAKAKVVINRDTETVVGATVLSNHADYLINIFTLMIDKQMKISDFNKEILAYPTFASDVQYLV
ncbi:NAD(P)/FAD-dependent oxidoreductase [Lentilactobacillus otakiensis]|uniref:Glutathione reductase n=1 Tax=Lentilactobacillus otakiensis DSM 19908 = JCM 15040 TaxID=1423780 RepID=S4PQU0_9LACO|nr:NAD(P)/FAD-dependent oxidoreductase [Lentilactobacillus otakiensis]KRL11850.1 glutathione-disulfide reductase [Lentilactobacillus otakiensis DSM 19908 = JCM 15040]MBZ3776029.1 NAD(P)/FAD-dependent oxidoreductase [Lentilactobacillus otakiensis]MDV3519190.1 NAD(P)/FAD-dependent oxidoreductase [Lentilactobacillus otakiensis]GAD17505.1 glutathione reductase [Lentilactobacillus otakiensis DSM 19908 = JCM 15040]